MTFRLDEQLLADMQQQALGEGRECVVGGLIARPDGAVFVQRRSMERRLFPGCWDIVGGHVEAGESLLAALRREIREETGWELARLLEPLATFDWETPGPDGPRRRREFDYLVEVAGDLDHPRLEEGKASEYRWLQAGEIELLRQGRSLADTAVLELVQRAFALLARRG